MRYEIQNFRFSKCEKDPDSFVYYFYSAVVDLFTYENFLWFKVNKKLEKDVPILCHCHMWPGYYETWIRADTGEALPSAYSPPLHKEVFRVRQEQNNAQLLERFVKLK